MRGLSLMLIYIGAIWFLSLVCLLVRIASWESVVDVDIYWCHMVS